MSTVSRYKHCIERDIFDISKLTRYTLFVTSSPSQAEQLRPHIELCIKIYEEFAACQAQDK